MCHTKLLDNYIGGTNLKSATQAISSINIKSGVGPCVRGLIICSCGSTGRVNQSAQLLKLIVERDIFDFVLAFAGVSTMDVVVVPALNRFIENVYIYDMKIWDALEESFGEDRHAMNHSPVLLSFADIKTDINDKRQWVVDTRMLALSNLRDGRPWGLDIFRCFNASCKAPAYNIIFHPSGKQYYGNQWVQTKIKYTCLQCQTVVKDISCPTWVHAAKSYNYGRVWYQWPLTAEQLQEIGVA
ncbi:uncharacterized protein F5147DRAFT_587452 [Suillus discolor]|uniref:Uncharacterized protein n=1 Tax=Suillus discolor TaxID=1912936 RepID=A0A9P7JLX7_9AGAM|nr:uncharacterized protein F5147DRAFT_587452 [Suillus discolor]KAG2088850.1 hypothetical protein F5147DRAFT_587452 [Suillus discolor]